MLRKTLEESAFRIRDLGILLTAEQQHLSGVLAERRNVYLKRTQPRWNSVQAARRRAKRVYNGCPVFKVIKEISVESVSWESIKMNT